MFAVLGLLMPFLPKLLGVFQSYLDHKFEMEMMQLRMQAAANEAQYRMDEIVTQARAAENIAARKEHESYGVKLLQAADRPDSKIWGWSFNTVFLAFSWLDWFISSVRPVITYWSFGLYTAVKVATVAYAYQASAKYSGGSAEALIKTFLNEGVWTAFDGDMLQLIVGFWFGNRLTAGRANVRQP